jgi:hypothetical protein
MHDGPTEQVHVPVSRPLMVGMLGCCREGRRWFVVGLPRSRMPHVMDDEEWARPVRLWVAWRASVADTTATTAAPITSPPWSARTITREGRSAGELMMKNTFFSSPTCGQGCKSLGDRCQLRRMYTYSPATLVRVACPHRRGGRHTTTAELGSARTLPHTCSDMGPRSRPRSRGRTC